MRRGRPIPRSGPRSGLRWVSLASLRSRAELFAPMRTADGAGGAGTVFAPVAQVWSRYTTEVARAATSEGRALLRERGRLVIRRRDDVVPGWRVEVAGRSWRVEAVGAPEPGTPFIALELVGVEP